MNRKECSLVLFIEYRIKRLQHCSLKLKRLPKGIWLYSFLIIRRNRMITLTANFFRSVIATTPEDLLPAVYLICNEVAPTFQGVELGIGDGLIIKALQDATGKSS